MIPEIIEAYTDPLGGLYLGTITLFVLGLVLKSVILTTLALFMLGVTIITVTVAFHAK